MTRDQAARDRLAADPVYLIKQGRPTARSVQRQGAGRRRDNSSPPSPAELDVLRLAADGYRNAEIAERLVKSEETVKTQIRRLLAHLKARDRTHAVAIALRRGLID